MIFHIEPVAHVLAIAVNGQRLPVSGIENHERNELLGKLKGSVVVRAVRGKRGQSVSVMVSPNEVIGSRFRRGVRAIGSVRRALRKSGFAGSERAKYFVCGDVQKPKGTSFRLAESVPVSSHFLQKSESSIYVGAEKSIGTKDGAIDVAFGGEVYDGLRLAALQQAAHKRAIGNISVNKFVTRIVRYSVQVMGITCICE